jgi:hypothetical protein
MTISSWRQNHMTLKLLLLVAVGTFPFFDFTVGWKRVSVQGPNVVREWTGICVCRANLGAGRSREVYKYSTEAEAQRGINNFVDAGFEFNVPNRVEDFQCTAGGLGFGLGSRYIGWGRAWAGAWASIFQIPNWIILYAAALPFILGMFRWCTRRNRVMGNLCLHCGYDLRASADRCPECGNPIAVAKPSTSPTAGSDTST